MKFLQACFAESILTKFSLEPISSYLLTVIVMSTACAHAEKPPSINELVGQLNGQHCRYEEDFDSDEIACKKRSNAHAAEKSLGHPRGKCHCAGIAASCLGSRKKGARNAVPELTKYLKRGQSDFANGGTEPTLCLTRVIEALGEIEDPAAVAPLVEFVRKPRKMSSEGVLSLSDMGWGAAVKALGRFGRSAKAALPKIIEGIQEGKDFDIYAEDPDILEAIGAIGDRSIAPLLLKNAGEVEALLKFKLDASSKFMEIYKVQSAVAPISGAIRGLTRLQDNGSQVCDQLAPVRDDYKLISSELQAWQQRNLGTPYNETIDEMHRKDLATELESLRINFVRLLGRCQDQDVLNAMLDPLIEPLEEGGPTDLDEKAILGYGDKLNPLLPRMKELASEVQWEEQNLAAPQSHLEWEERKLKNAKRNRAQAIIRILKAHGSPAAIQALSDLKNNQYLRPQI
jgi:HEAT repeat protein